MHQFLANTLRSMQTTMARPTLRIRRMTVSTSSCHVVNCLTSAGEAAIGTRDARWILSVLTRFR